MQMCRCLNKKPSLVNSCIFFSHLFFLSLALGFLLLAAVYISSASSCLATLYGTPRVLQSIAAENIIPGLARLAEGVSIRLEK